MQSVGLCNKSIYKAKANLKHYKFKAQCHASFCICIFFGFFFFFKYVNIAEITNQIKSFVEIIPCKDIQELRQNKERIKGCDSRGMIPSFLLILVRLFHVQKRLILTW